MQNNLRQEQKTKNIKTTVKNERKKVIYQTEKSSEF